MALLCARRTKCALPNGSQMVRQVANLDAGGWCVADEGQVARSSAALLGGGGGKQGRCARPRAALEWLGDVLAGARPDDVAAPEVEMAATIPRAPDGRV